MHTRSKYCRRFLIMFVMASFLGLLFPAPGHAATRLVTTANDSGPGSLRATIAGAGANDTIVFDPSVFPVHDPTTIYVATALPYLVQNGLRIDASNAGVIIDGSRAPAGSKGLVLKNSHITVQGLTIQKFNASGILIDVGAGQNTIGGDRTAGAGPHGQGNAFVLNGGNGIEVLGSANFIGGNTIGGTLTTPGSNYFNGIALWQGAANNTIGSANHNYANVIGWNKHNGIWIGGSGTSTNRILGNKIGVQADGYSFAGNVMNGIAIQSGATGNDIGGIAPGEGNVISRNAGNGVYISDAGTRLNRVLGNRIGTNEAGTNVAGQGLSGILVALGASDNTIGDSSPAGRNLIGGNAYDGIKLSGSTTADNQVKGNYIGSDASGSYAIPNGMHGVEFTDDTSYNAVGGNRLAGQGNLISGNENHGVVFTNGAHHNTLQGNLIGPDQSGTASLGHHPFGAINVTEGAHDNTIGGVGPGEGNVISGNQMDGIALFVTQAGSATTGHNRIIGNRIGLKLAVDEPLANTGPGILNTYGASGTWIEANLIANNDGYGITNTSCTGNTITRNSIYGNRLGAVFDESNCVPTAVITDVVFAGSETVAGKALPNGTVEVFSDDDGQARTYEGSTTADGNGDFLFSKAGGFAGNDVAIIVTDGSGNSSALSMPYHLQWTIALYFNGDNNLEEFLLDTISNTVSAVGAIIEAGHSPRANIVALVDGKDLQAETVLIDLTNGRRTVHGEYLPHEQNMGDGQTLVNFMAWVNTTYPARHTLLSIADHGGGWAPSSEIALPGSQPGRRRFWLAGGSGLSWDESSDFDYLDIGETRAALATITNNGANPLDVVFFDVCLMGMLEVAYELRAYADIFVSSQNIGWAPLGPQNRYAELIGRLPANSSSGDLAALLVSVYGSTLPEDGHPYTIAAVDLGQMTALRSAVDGLAAALAQLINDQAAADVLAGAYRAAQKLDYDSDFAIEAHTDGFVDLYDFAARVREQYTDPAVVNAAQSVMQVVDTAVISEDHQSGTPWMLDNREWNLDNVHGLSIFLPLGEDLELPVTPDEPSRTATNATPGPNLKLRDVYTATQLSFVADSSWRALIDRYYWAVAQPVPTALTTGPVAGLQPPDNEPPKTALAVSGEPTMDGILVIDWVATDLQSGVAGATLMHRSTRADWQAVATATSATGQFTFQIQEFCQNWLAVQSRDLAGNVEPVVEGANTYTYTIEPCYHAYLPSISP